MLLRDLSITPTLAGLLVVCLVVGALWAIVSTSISGTASGTMTGFVLAIFIGKRC